MACDVLRMKMAEQRRYEQIARQKREESENRAPRDDRATLPRELERERGQD